MIVQVPSDWEAEPQRPLPAVDDAVRVLPLLPPHVDVPQERARSPAGGLAAAHRSAIVLYRTPQQRLQRLSNLPHVVNLLLIVGVAFDKLIS